MNELLDLLAQLDKRMIEKLCGMKEPKYLLAVQEARGKINEAQNIIALANK